MRPRDGIKLSSHLRPVNRFIIPIYVLKQAVGLCPVAGLGEAGFPFTLNFQLKLSPQATMEAGGRITPVGRGLGRAGCARVSSNFTGIAPWGLIEPPFRRHSISANYCSLVVKKTDRFLHLKLPTSTVADRRPDGGFTGSLT